MRSYPRNSPEAAARIVALLLIADGHVCRSEIETLKHLQLEQTLGLPDGRFGQVMHTLCEDLLLGAAGTGSLMCSVDASTLAALMAEIDEPSLQRSVLRLVNAAADADDHLADAGTLVLEAARRHWGTAASQSHGQGASAGRVAAAAAG
jgi:hypothetical protein